MNLKEINYICYMDLSGDPNITSNNKYHLDYSTEDTSITFASSDRSKVIDKMIEILQGMVG